MSSLKLGSKLLCYKNLDGYTVGKIYNITKIHLNYNDYETSIELINDYGVYSVFTIKPFYGLSYSTWFISLSEERRRKLIKINNL